MCEAVQNDSEADSSAATDDVGFDLFRGPVGDFLFGAGPIKAVQSWLGLGHGDAFHRIALLGDTWGLALALGVAFWLYGRDTTHALLGAVALGVGHHGHKRVPISSFPSGHAYQIPIPWVCST